MLMEQSWRYRMDEFDLKVFEAVLPTQHALIDALELIDWPSFAGILEEYYCRDRGQPAISPIVMLKLEFLRYFYNLGDSQVIQRAATDLAFRWFLQVPLHFKLPDSSLMTKFRGRLGDEGFNRVFDQLVVSARKAGLVKDRLRLKDASHIIAKIAIPRAVGLISQTRDCLLELYCLFDAQGAEGFRISAQLVRERTQGAAVEIQLEQRVNLLKDIVHSIEGLAVPADADKNLPWQRLVEKLALAQKILNDQANPDQGRRTLSLVDPEARRGKHGDWYEGYVLDVLMDADSELITKLQVLEAGGDEAESALELTDSEQATHDNKIEAISIDGAGFNGKMLRGYEERQIEAIVPPKPIPSSAVFANTQFELSADGSSVTCPAGQTSSYAQADKRRNGTIFRFKRSQCDGCPLVAKCMPKPHSGLFGRSVQKNDYQGEYDRARAKASTERYQEVRREHPAIERKLNEIMNHHRGRKARGWGQAKVSAQQHMTAVVVNVKRMIKLCLNGAGETRTAVA